MPPRDGTPRDTHPGAATNETRHPPQDAGQFDSNGPAPRPVSRLETHERLVDLGIVDDDRTPDLRGGDS
jgi:hypothetical protein